MFIMKVCKYRDPLFMHVNFSSHCASLQIDVKDMGFPRSISEINTLHKAESTPFPPQFAVSLTRQSEYDSLATELKISLENNGTVTNSCVKFPVTISKLRSRTIPGNDWLLLEYIATNFTFKYRLVVCT